VKYDYLIVGSGLFGCTFANLAINNNQKCLIIDKRNHSFGNCYTNNLYNIQVHQYGPHIFHTNNENIWNYVNKFDTFNAFIYKPKVVYKDKIFSFPINLMTFYQLWDIHTPIEAISKIEQVKMDIKNPQNLEDYALSTIGRELYDIFIYGYTKKQWNIEPKELPAFILKRLPIRFTFDENYFLDKYQGIPENGYSYMMKNMIRDTEIILDTNYFDDREYWNSLAKKVVYTGPIDEYFDYCYDPLEYRSLRFEHQVIPQEDYQGNSVMNYTDIGVEYTRIIEHKHFTPLIKTNQTIITKEYPCNFKNNTPYYPINNSLNNNRYHQYKKLALTQNKTIFGGRLAEYRYYNMDQIIASSFNKFYKLNGLV
jgi:UDP-galactopyranose mutase